MREIRPSGSEGGVEQANAPSLPLSGVFGGVLVGVLRTQGEL